MRRRLPSGAPTSGQAGGRASYVVSPENTKLYAWMALYVRVWLHVYVHVCTCAPRILDVSLHVCAARQQTCLCPVLGCDFVCFIISLCLHILPPHVLAVEVVRRLIPVNGKAHESPFGRLHDAPKLLRFRLMAFQGSSLKLDTRWDLGCSAPPTRPVNVRLHSLHRLA